MAAGRDIPTAERPGVGGFPVVFVVSVLSLAAYLLFLPSSVYWLDSPEFIAAAANLGLAHPPGHPVAAMAMKLFTLLPVGDIPFRANLFGAVCGALAAGLTGGIARVVAAEILQRNARAVKPAGGRKANVGVRAVDGLWPALAGLAAGIMFAGCRSLFIQSMAAEVYMLNGALLLGALYIMMSGPVAGDARRGMAAAVLLGLALANHHFLAILAVPALVAAFWNGRASLRPLLAVAAVSVAMALACYLYLPIRAGAGAWPTWSGISGVGDFFWYVSASIFSGSVGGFEQTGAGPLQNIGLAFVLIATSLGVMTPVLALGGAWFALRSGAVRGVASLLLLLLGGVVSKVMMGILDPSNPDDHGYFMMALAALSVLAPMALMIPVALAGANRGALAARITAGVLMMSVAAWPWGGGIEVGRSRLAFDHTSRLADVVWSGVPDGGVAFVSHYPVYFVMQYQQVVEDARPDVALVQESLYYKARGGLWYADAMAVRAPDLAGVMSGFRSSGRLSWPELSRLAAHRPVVFEASPDFDAVLSDLVFEGWFFRMRPVPAEADAAVAGRAHVATLARRFGRAAADNVETRRVVLRNLASSAEWAIRAEDATAAVELLDGAERFNPGDRLLRKMRNKVGGRGVR